MLSLDQALEANRSLIFVVAESDLEVLLHLSRVCKKDLTFLYSQTIAAALPLEDVLKSGFTRRADLAKGTVDVLTDICHFSFPKSNNKFHKYIFLDSQAYISDPIHIRWIKDIISRYQMDSSFTMNLIFISQTVVVPPALERLSEVVFFDLPNEEKLGSLATSIYKRLRLDPENKDEITLNLKGLTLFEAEQAILQSHSIYQKADLNFIRSFKKNSIAKTDLLSLFESDTTFDIIGGMDRLKAWIRKSAGGWTVEGQRYGLPIMKGVLLVGPPGTGKSMIAKSIGNEYGLPVISFDPSKLFSSQVGSSEANLRRILKIIESVAPCVLFIDEIEKGLAGSQSSTFSDAGTTARVVGTFLTWFQDCQKSIFTIATSNGIQYLPPEMISRFDEVFFVNLPQLNERRDIFNIHIKLNKRDPEKFNTSLLAEHSVELTGREIGQVIKEAMYDAFHSQDGSGKPTEINTEHILEVLKKKTSVAKVMHENMKALYKWVGWDKEKKDGIRARYASLPEDLDVNKIQMEIDSLINEIEKPKTEGM